MTNEPLSGAELSALSAYELGVELNRVDDELSALTDAAVEAVKAQVKADCRLDANPHDLDAKMEAKIQRAALKVAELKSRRLRSRRSSIQTLLRAVPQ